MPPRKNKGNKGVSLSLSEAFGPSAATVDDQYDADMAVAIALSMAADNLTTTTTAPSDDKPPLTAQGGQTILTATKEKKPQNKIGDEEENNTNKALAPPAPAKNVWASSVQSAATVIRTAAASASKMPPTTTEVNENDGDEEDDNANDIIGRIVEDSVCEGVLTEDDGRDTHMEWLSPSSSSAPLNNTIGADCGGREEENREVASHTQLQHKTERHAGKVALLANVYRFNNTCGKRDEERIHTVLASTPKVALVDDNANEAHTVVAPQDYTPSCTCLDTPKCLCGFRSRLFPSSSANPNPTPQSLAAFVKKTFLHGLSAPRVSVPSAAEEAMGEDMIDFEEAVVTHRAFSQSTAKSENKISAVSRDNEHQQQQQQPYFNQRYHPLIRAMLQKSTPTTLVVSGVSGGSFASSMFAPPLDPLVSPYAVTSRGLRNMSCNCYFNAIVQMLFHIPEARQSIILNSSKFRRIIWEKRSSDSGKNVDCEGSNTAGSSPTSTSTSSNEHKGLANLQLAPLFTEMLFSTAPVIDTYDAVVNGLGINPTIQQDAQEFLGLLLTTLSDLAPSVPVSSPLLPSSSAAATTTPTLAKDVTSSITIDETVPSELFDLKKVLQTTFVTQELYKRECGNCKHASYRADTAPFLTLSCAHQSHAGSPSSSASGRGDDYNKNITFFKDYLAAKAQHDAELVRVVKKQERRSGRKATTATNDDTAEDEGQARANNEGGQADGDNNYTINSLGARTESPVPQEPVGTTTTTLPPNHGIIVGVLTRKQRKALEVLPEGDAFRLLSVTRRSPEVLDVDQPISDLEDEDVGEGGEEGSENEDDANEDEVSNEKEDGKELQERNGQNKTAKSKKKIVARKNNQPSTLAAQNKMNKIVAAANKQKVVKIVDGEPIHEISVDRSGTEDDAEQLTMTRKRANANSRSTSRRLGSVVDLLNSEDEAALLEDEFATATSKSSAPHNTSSSKAKSGGKNLNNNNNSKSTNNKKNTAGSASTPASSAIVLEDALLAFLAPEKIEGYRCEQCNTNVIVNNNNTDNTAAVVPNYLSSRMLLKKLPNVLVLHLNRFSYDFMTGDRKKNHCVVNFPEILDMDAVTEAAAVLFETDNNSNTVSNSSEGKKSFAEEQGGTRNLFRLSGIVNHVGSSPHGGHYTYYGAVPVPVPNSLEGKENSEKEETTTTDDNPNTINNNNNSSSNSVFFQHKWVKYDDNTVTDLPRRFSAHERLQSRDPYVLVYRRVEQPRITAEKKGEEGDKDKEGIRMRSEIDPSLLPLMLSPFETPSTSATQKAMNRMMTPLWPLFAPADLLLSVLAKNEQMLLRYSFFDALRKSLTAQVRAWLLLSNTFAEYPKALAAAKKKKMELMDAMSVAPSNDINDSGESEGHSLQKAKTAFADACLPYRVRLLLGRSDNTQKADNDNQINGKKTRSDEQGESDPDLYYAVPEQWLADFGNMFMDWRNSPASVISTIIEAEKEKLAKRRQEEEEEKQKTTALAPSKAKKPSSATPWDCEESVFDSLMSELGGTVETAATQTSSSVVGGGVTVATKTASSAARLRNASALANATWSIPRCRIVSPECFSPLKYCAVARNEEVKEEESNINKKGGLRVDDQSDPKPVNSSSAPSSSPSPFALPARFTNGLLCPHNRLIPFYYNATVRKKVLQSQQQQQQQQQSSSSRDDDTAIMGVKMMNDECGGEGDDNSPLNIQYTHRYKLVPAAVIKAMKAWYDVFVKAEEKEKCIAHPGSVSAAAARFKTAFVSMTADGEEEEKGAREQGDNNNNNNSNDECAPPEATSKKPKSTNNNSKKKSSGGTSADPTHHVLIVRDSYTPSPSASNFCSLALREQDFSEAAAAAFSTDERRSTKQYWLRSGDPADEIESNTVCGSSSSSSFSATNFVCVPCSVATLEFLRQERQQKQRERALKAATLLFGQKLIDPCVAVAESEVANESSNKKKKRSRQEDNGDSSSDLATHPLLAPLIETTELTTKNTADEANKQNNFSGGQKDSSSSTAVSSGQQKEEDLRVRSLLALLSSPNPIPEVAFLPTIFVRWWLSQPFNASGPANAFRHFIGVVPSSAPNRTLLTAAPQSKTDTTVVSDGGAANDDFLGNFFAAMNDGDCLDFAQNDDVQREEEATGKGSKGKGKNKTSSSNSKKKRTKKTASGGAYFQSAATSFNEKLAIINFHTTTLAKTPSPLGGATLHSQSARLPQLLPPPDALTASASTFNLLTLVLCSLHGSISMDSVTGVDTPSDLKDCPAAAATAPPLTAVPITLVEYLVRVRGYDCFYLGEPAMGAGENGEGDLDAYSLTMENGDAAAEDNANDNHGGKPVVRMLISRRRSDDSQQATTEDDITNEKSTTATSSTTTTTATRRRKAKRDDTTGLQLPLCCAACEKAEATSVNLRLVVKAAKEDMFRRFTAVIGGTEHCALSVLESVSAGTNAQSSSTATDNKNNSHFFDPIAPISATNTTLLLASTSSHGSLLSRGYFGGPAIELPLKNTSHGGTKTTAEKEVSGNSGSNAKSKPTTTTAVSFAEESTFVSIKSLAVASAASEYAHHQEGKTSPSARDHHHHAPLVSNTSSSSATSYRWIVELLATTRFSSEINKLAFKRDVNGYTKTTRKAWTRYYSDLGIMPSTTTTISSTNPAAMMTNSTNQQQKSSGVVTAVSAKGKDAGGAKNAAAPLHPQTSASAALPTNHPQIPDWQGSSYFAVPTLWAAVIHMWIRSDTLELPILIPARPGNNIHENNAKSTPPIDVGSAVAEGMPYAERLRVRMRENWFNAWDYCVYTTQSFSAASRCGKQNEKNSKNDGARGKTVGKADDRIVAVAERLNLAEVLRVDDLHPSKCVPPTLNFNGGSGGAKKRNSNDKNQQSVGSFALAYNCDDDNSNSSVSIPVTLGHRDGGGGAYNCMCDLVATHNANVPQQGDVTIVNTDSHQHQPLGLDLVDLLRDLLSSSASSLPPGGDPLTEALLRSPMLLATPPSTATYATTIPPLTMIPIELLPVFISRLDPPNSEKPAATASTAVVTAPAPTPQTSAASKGSRARAAAAAANSANANTNSSPCPLSLASPLGVAEAATALAALITAQASAPSTAPVAANVSGSATGDANKGKASGVSKSQGAAANGKAQQQQPLQGASGTPLAPPLPPPGAPLLPELKMKLEMATLIHECLVLAGAKHAESSISSSLSLAIDNTPLFTIEKLVPFVRELFAPFPSYKKLLLDEEAKAMESAKEKKKEEGEQPPKKPMGSAARARLAMMSGGSATESPNSSSPSPSAFPSPKNASPAAVTTAAATGASKGEGEGSVSLVSPLFNPESSTPAAAATTVIITIPQLFVISEINSERVFSPFNQSSDRKNEKENEHLAARAHLLRRKELMRTVEYPNGGSLFVHVKIRVGSAGTNTTATATSSGAPQKSAELSMSDGIFIDLGEASKPSLTLIGAVPDASTTTVFNLCNLISAAILDKYRYIVPADQLMLFPTKTSLAAFMKDALPLDTGSNCVGIDKGKTQAAAAATSKVAEEYVPLTAEEGGVAEVAASQPYLDSAVDKDTPLALSGIRDRCTIYAALLATTATRLPPTAAAAAANTTMTSGKNSKGAGNKKGRGGRAQSSPEEAEAFGNTKLGGGGMYVAEGDSEDREADEEGETDNIFSSPTHGETTYARKTQEERQPAAHNMARTESDDPELAAAIAASMVVMEQTSTHAHAGDAQLKKNKKDKKKAGSSPSPSQPAVKECAVCTYHNNGSAKFCEMCESLLPS